MTERYCVGVDMGSRDLAGMEHDTLVTLRHVGLTAEVATHIVGGCYVTSVAVLGADTAERLARAFSKRGMTAASFPSIEAAGEGSKGYVRAQTAAAAQHEKQSGRLITFAGDDSLSGTASVDTLVTKTPIDEVVALGGEVGPDDLVVIDGFARPTYEGGRLILHVTPLADGRFRTFEISNPHQCCGGLH